MNTNTHTNKKVGQVSRPPHLENRVKCIEYLSPTKCV